MSELREISTDELKIILDKHALWLEGGEGGERADLHYADLHYADLSSANLRDADLSSADLHYADLHYADLSSADLRDATGQYFITQRSDGCQFFLALDEDGRWMIRAGCQYRSIEDYRKHTLSYDEESKRIETVLILDFAEAKLATVEQPKEEAA